MQERPPFSVAGRVRSFRFAIRGIRTVLRTQHNAWIHAVATVLVVALGLGVGISRLEWCLIVFVIIAVWTAEALNTALELLCDVASPEFHPLIERSKDVAAGAVLLSSVGAAVVGLFVLGPPTLRVIENLIWGSAR